MESPTHRALNLDEDLPQYLPVTVKKNIARINVKLENIKSKTLKYESPIKEKKISRGMSSKLEKKVISEINIDNIEGPVSR
jgi:hypothetical protein